MKRDRTGKIIEILTALQTGRCYTIADLCKMFRASQRTIARDLRELRTIGVPYRYDVKTGGYVVEPDFFLPPANLNVQEALSILILAHMVGEQIQFPFKNSALLAALKIVSNLPIKIRQYCNAALQNVSIRTDHPKSVGLPDSVFTQLLTAIMRKRAVSIKYHMPHKQKSVTANLSPYHLVYNEKAWYVLGKSNLRKRIRALKLNQIKELNISDKCYIEDDKFSVSEYLGQAWSMTPEGKLYDVKLRFLSKIAHSVAEFQWHSTQKVTFEDDGSVIIEFQVDGLNEITWWILSYGDQVKVLAPGILRQRIIEIAQNTIKQNEQLMSI